uniref:Uncharacterized protein LOC111114215 n=1 Tax=Crassostrea virginica TaxID=6565 RepID=A0A8B8BXU3_CRAVI|nr:uncharacterized protein LOC111114215 [Crassostrea virginica]
MDPQCSGQDIVRCSLCKTDVTPLHCTVCFIHLCEDCEDKHTSDSSKVHNVVSFKQLLSIPSIPKCSMHSTERYKFHCKQCNVLICALCVSSNEHKQHNIVGILEHYKKNQNAIRRDLQELDKFIYPEYSEVISAIPTQRADVEEHTPKMKEVLINQEEALHLEIDFIIQKKLADIDEINSQLLTAIYREEEALINTMEEISMFILDMSLMDESDVCLVSKYRSKNEQFRQNLFKHNISLQNLCHQDIKREKLSELAGSMPSSSKETVEQNNPQQSQKSNSGYTDILLLESPVLLTELNTGYKFLYEVSSWKYKEIWTSGEPNFMKLYNLQGKLLKSIQTITGNTPDDITVTRRGEHVYTDYGDRSINVVCVTHLLLFRIPETKSKTDVLIRTLIRLKGWTPRFLCSSSLDNLLVMMISDDGKQTKIVRYCDSTEKESIQFDDKGKPLYSSGYTTMYLSENRNTDICVADFAAREVVVVSSAGKLRFRYTGPPLTTNGIFRPVGITTDSQCRILTTDRENDLIHIVDKDGHFLRYIDNCGLDYPRGLSVDSEDNLLVAEYYTGSQ